MGETCSKHREMGGRDVHYFIRK